MSLPNTKVEIAFDSGYTTPAASRTWTDVSAYVEAQSALTITRGRQDNISQVQPSTLSLTLDNRDGRFTPEKTGGAYYPNVKKGRPIRVTSTYNAVSYVRFVGYINEWPVVWPDSTSAVSTVSITASSRMARLGLGAELAAIPLANEILADSPVAYYQLNDAAGSTTATTSRGGDGPLTLAGSGTDPSFGVTPGPGLTDSTAATFAGGQYLVSTLSEPTGGLGQITAVEIAFRTTAVSQEILGAINGFGILTLNGTGRLVFSDQASTIFTSTNPVNDDAWHLAAMVWYGNSSATECYLDGVLVATGGLTPSQISIRLGFGFVGSLAQFSMYFGPFGADYATHYAAMATGFAGERSDERIARLARYAGVPSAEMSLDTGTALMSAITTDGQTPVALMNAAADTENGVLYDAKDSTGSLRFKGRASRYNAASSFTLDATTQEVQGDLLPTLDDQFLANDVTTTGDGVQGRSTDLASVADYGYYRQSIQLTSADANDVQAAADWRVGLNKQPTVRYPTVSVDIVNLSTAQAALVLAADIGTRFGLSNLPSQAPATTADFFAEGTSETITEASHMLTFNTSSTYGYAGTTGVWQLDVNNIDGPYVLAL